MKNRPQAFSMLAKKALQGSFKSRVRVVNQPQIKIIVKSSGLLHGDVRKTFCCLSQQASLQTSRQISKRASDRKSVELRAHGHFLQNAGVTRQQAVTKLEIGLTYV